MLNITDQLKGDIKTIILELEKEYQETKAFILTEGDLQCLLFSKLKGIPRLEDKAKTEDSHIEGTYIHSEISWYDKEGKLTIKPDITIMDPGCLSILYGRPTIIHGKQQRTKLPSKQYIFRGPAIIFELKFIRNKTGIRAGTLNTKIKKDINKITELFSKLDEQGYNNEVYCYFVIFNKTDKRCSEFNNFMNINQCTKRYEIIYCTGRVHF